MVTYAHGALLTVVEACVQVRATPTEAVNKSHASLMQHCAWHKLHAAGRTPHALGVTLVSTSTL